MTTFAVWDPSNGETVEDSCQHKAIDASYSFAGHITGGCTLLVLNEETSEVVQVEVTLEYEPIFYSRKLSPKEIARRAQHEADNQLRSQLYGQWFTLHYQVDDVTLYAHAIAKGVAPEDAKRIFAHYDGTPA